LNAVSAAKDALDKNRKKLQVDIDNTNEDVELRKIRNYKLQFRSFLIKLVILLES